MDARVLEARRLLLGSNRLEILLEEREDGEWNLRFGHRTADSLYLARTASESGRPPAHVSDLLYKAEMFDHMVEHFQHQLERTVDAASADTAQQMTEYVEVGLCTNGLSDEALEAMAREFESENFTERTLDEIAAWAKDILAIRHKRIEPIIPQPDLLRR